MSAVQINVRQVIQQQIIYKAHSFADMIWALIIVQIGAMLLSLNNVGGGVSGLGSLHISYTSYNAIFVMMFTMLWIAISAFVMTSRSYALEDFTFISTHGTRHTANALFLLLAAIVGALTSVLSSFAVRMIHVLAGTSEVDMVIGANIDAAAFATGTGAMFGYLCLCASAGYFLGQLFQVNRRMQALLILLIVLSIFGSPWIAEPEPVRAFVQIYASESSLGIFLIKTTVTAAVLFAFAGLFASRKEVR